MEEKNSIKAIDPVCGMQVVPESAAGSLEHQGKKYYFCSKRCVQKFSSDPEKYLSAKPNLANMAQSRGSNLVQLGPATKSKAKTSAEKATAYICPMDPEVRESKPGPCPICGMA